jgi:type IV pilus assembly protein PilQ
MIIRRAVLIFMILLLSGVPLLSGQAPLAAVNSEITDISVSVENGTSEIEITCSAPFTYTIYKPADPYQIVIDLQDTDLGIFREKMNFDKAGVLDITPVSDSNAPDVARLQISLTVPADVEPIYKDNSLILAFDNPDIMEEAEEIAGTDAMEEMEAYVDEAELMEDVEPEEKPVKEKQYTGEKISIDFQDAELIHVFRLIADISGYNIVVSPDVKGKFSMKLMDVPWDQALDVILRNYTLSKSIEGNIIRIAPTSVLAREEEEIARAKESQEKAGNLVTKIYPINYADVEAIKTTIADAKILTKRGFISVDERTTSIIIKDVDNKHPEYEKIINALDMPTPQVSIEARIVEVRTNSLRDLGIQWGVLGKPNPQTQIAGTGLASDTDFSSGKPMMVNLPASAAAGSIGFGYIGAGALRALNIELTAIENAGNGRTISNPRVITMDNQEAVIRQGKKIPYTTVSDEGTKTEFVDAALELKVTPHITPEGTILMTLNVNKNDANFEQTSGIGDVPTIDTNEISTQVLIKDSDTLALGGIFKTNESENETSVPFLSKIPFIGRLFKSESTKDDVTEMLIFITPRIIK